MLGARAGGGAAGGTAQQIPEDQIKPESALLAPGSKANETIIVRKADGSIWAYAWNVDSCSWDTLGEVMGAAPGGGGGNSAKQVRQHCSTAARVPLMAMFGAFPSAAVACSCSSAPGGTHQAIMACRRPCSRKLEHSSLEHMKGFCLQWYDGQEWDIVIDVEMDAGAKLKLPLNKDEDPYDVADRFLHKHGLPEAFKQQVVQFILDNVGDAGVLLVRAIALGCDADACPPP